MKTEHLVALLLTRQLSSSRGLVGDCQRRGDRSGLKKDLVRRETGTEVRMEESYREGLASHPDPESCGGARKGAAEALTGEHAGKVLSRGSYSRAPTLSIQAERRIRTGGIASPDGTLRGRRPLACVETPCAGTGRSHGRPAVEDWAASGRPKAARR